MNNRGNLLTIADTGSGGTTISGIISGAGGLTVNSSATVSLSAANTFSGPVTLSSGTLQMSGSGTLGAIANTLAASGGTLDLGATSQQTGAVTISGGVIQDGTLSGASYTASNAGAATISALLAGSGKMTDNGAGTLTLTNSNNSYSGGTTLGAGSGILNFVSGALGPGTNLTFLGGTLQYAPGNTQDVSALIGAVTKSTGAISIDVNGNTVVFNNKISSNNTGGLIANSSISGGSLTLNGANAYTGVTTIENVTVNVSTYTSISTAGSLGAPTTNDNARLFFDATNGGVATLNYTGVGNTANRLFTAESNATINNIGSGALNINNAGALGFTATSPVTLSFGGSYIGTNSFAPIILDSSSTNTTSLVVDGSSWLFSGNNTFSGGATITSGGALVGVSNVGSTSGALGTGPVTLGGPASGATASLLIDGAFTFSNPIDVASSVTVGTLSIGGATDSNSTFSGAITLDNSLAISQVATASGNTLALTGGIIGGSHGPQSVAFAGPGMITVGNAPIVDDGANTISVNVTAGVANFSIANAYSGGTSVAVGATLVASNSSGSATGGGPVVVDGTLAGNGAITGSLSVGGGQLAPSLGGAGGALPANLTLGSVNLADAQSSLNYQLGTANGSDLISVNGNLSIFGGTRLNISSSSFAALSGPTAYELFSYTGSLYQTGDGGGLQIGSVPTGYSYTFVYNTPNQVDLLVSLVPEPATWVMASMAAIGLLGARCWSRMRKVRRLTTGEERKTNS